MPVNKVPILFKQYPKTMDPLNIVKEQLYFEEIYPHNPL